MSDDVAALNSVPTEEGLNQLQLTTLQYYLHESNPANGLIRDKTDPSAPCSIAAVGLALATIPVLVERGVISREFAPEVALRTLRFFRDSPQGPEADATGYKGFYYHFLDIFNQTYAVPDSPTGWWVTPYHFGIDQGPVALMTENYRTGLIWEIMRRCPYVKVGLRRAGFRGSWL